MSTQPRYLGLAWGALTLGAVLLAALLLNGRAFADPASTYPASLSGVDGQQVYEHICRGCHMADAVGAVGAGRYPALAQDPALVSRQFMALTILMGRRNMPAFGAKHAIAFGSSPTVLNNAQIAAVVNYVRSHFGNHYKDQITAAEVSALDSATK